MEIKGGMFSPYLVTGSLQPPQASKNIMGKVTGAGIWPPPIDATQMYCSIATTAHACTTAATIDCYKVNYRIYSGPVAYATGVLIVRIPPGEKICGDGTIQRRKISTPPGHSKLGVAAKPKFMHDFQFWRISTFLSSLREMQHGAWY